MVHLHHQREDVSDQNEQRDPASINFQYFLLHRHFLNDVPLNPDIQIYLTHAIHHHFMDVGEPSVVADSRQAGDNEVEHLHAEKWQ